MSALCLVKSSRYKVFSHQYNFYVIPFFRAARLIDEKAGRCRCWVTISRSFIIKKYSTLVLVMLIFTNPDQVRTDELTGIWREIWNKAYTWFWYTNDMAYDGILFDKKQLIKTCPGCIQCELLLLLCQGSKLNFARSTEASTKSTGLVHFRFESSRGCVQ